MPLYFQIFLFIFLIVGSLAFKTPVAGQKTITSLVKLSICGDGIIEGNEQCDRLDLNHQTCLGLGRFNGTLACDIACDYDFSGCHLLPSPTSGPITLTSAPSPIINDQLSLPLSLPENSFFTRVITVIYQTVINLIRNLFDLLTKYLFQLIK